jgi:hypothetical protein
MEANSPVNFVAKDETRNAPDASKPAAFLKRFSCSANRI